MRQLTISKQITNRETLSLDKYLQEIGKVDLITMDEEVNLAQRIRQGDTMALEKLTKANLRFVVSVAKQYQNYGLSLGDLINEGNLGLIRAAKRFDETRGFKFISYAVWWIRQSIMQGLAEQARIVRIPLNRVSGFNKILKTLALLEQEYQREPTTQEIADTIGVSAEEVMLNQQHTGRHVSVDAPFIDGEENSLLDVLSDPSQELPDKGMLVESLKIEIRRALTHLPLREAEIITLFFGLNGQPALKLGELGEKLNLTTERVRQIKEQATRRLRQALRNTALESYL
jgi:RNA polymerase primary sigma factor